MRHHHRYHKDDSDQQIIIQREGQYPQLHQKIRIRVRSTSTDKGVEINNNQNHVNKSSFSAKSRDPSMLKVINWLSRAQTVLTLSFFGFLSLFLFPMQNHTTKMATEDLLQPGHVVKERWK